MVVLLIVAYFILVIYEFIPLYKQKQWADFWVNTFLGALSFTVAVMLSFNIKIPSPAKPIENFITSIFGK